ncbi:MFS transporter [Tepidiforma sp.]|uniref:MFS transporter n=1 Tax=Tepidiforma sp. TaxID=2682230 RepID=UPI002ADD4C57|nr:MFS transporter [Tepidiforma sp.]
MRPRRPFQRIPRIAWLLGFTSLFADLSSELAYPLIPIFLTSVLGAPVAAVGLVEGIAEATANLVRPFAGRWSDRTGRRKPFVVAGYALAAAGKLVIVAAPAWGFALAGRAVDRFGKGLRNPPRDAMLADAAPAAERGRVFGFHRAMDTLGAVLGPLAGLGLLLALGEDRLRWALALALVPAAVSVLVVARVPELRPAHPPSQDGLRGQYRRLPRSFWLLLGATTLFMLGNSSDAFLILRAKDLGLATTAVILAYVLYNLVYAAAAYPAGSLSDRIPRRAVVIGGYLVFAVVYLGFALAEDGAFTWPLFALYGAYIAAAEGVLKAFVADLTPAELRTTALGLFQGVTGGAVLVASLTAGVLWDAIGPAAPFYFGAACALLAALATLAARPGAANPAP